MTPSKFMMPRKVTVLPGMVGTAQGAVRKPAKEAPSEYGRCTQLQSVSIVPSGSGFWRETSLRGESAAGAAAAPEAAPSPALTMQAQEPLFASSLEEPRLVLERHRQSTSS